MSMPEWNDATSPELLHQALWDGDVATAARLIEALRADVSSLGRRVDALTARSVLSSLRTHAWFDELFEVAAVLARYGQDEPTTRAQLALAMIEKGEVTAAIEVLLQLAEKAEGALAGTGSDPEGKERLEEELGEALGLLGRAYKQLYIDARPRAGELREADFEKACGYYHRAYRERLGDFRWHGVNYVALLTHAERVREGNPRAYADPAREVAESLLERLLERESGIREPWDWANIVECNLALGRSREAIEACRAYLEHAAITPFQLQSTRRQFVELWMLEKSEPPGRTILPMMEARLAALGARRDLDLGAVDPRNLEVIWGETRYQPLDWLREGVTRASAIARIGPDSSRGMGTGFLLIQKLAEPLAFELVTLPRGDLLKDGQHVLLVVGQLLDGPFRVDGLAKGALDLIRVELGLVALQLS